MENELTWVPAYTSTQRKLELFESGQARAMCPESVCSISYQLYCVLEPPHQHRQQLSHTAKLKGQQVSSRYLRSGQETVAAMHQPGNSAQLGQDMLSWYSDAILSMNNTVGVFQPLQSWLPVLLQGEEYGLGERVQRDLDLSGQKKEKG